MATNATDGLLWVADPGEAARPPAVPPGADERLGNTTRPYTGRIADNSRRISQSNPPRKPPKSLSARKGLIADLSATWGFDEADAAKRAECETAVRTATSETNFDGQRLWSALLPEEKASYVKNFQDSLKIRYVPQRRTTFD